MPGARAPTDPDLCDRIVERLRRFGWLAAISVTVVIGSERMYWYWTDIDVGSMALLASFYLLAVSTAMFALGTTNGSHPANVVMAGSAFAIVVEGIITPVIYEDGPLPLLYAMFVGWHGLLAFAGLVFIVRYAALEWRITRMAVGSVALGIGWGLWSLTSSTVDEDTPAQMAAEGLDVQILTPAQFASYAVRVVVVLVAAHAVIDRLWPTVGWRPSRRALVAAGLACAALGALVVLPVVPWAPLKLAALGWFTWRLRVVEPPTGAALTVIDRCAGRVRLRDLTPLLLIAPAAAVTYAALWPARHSAAIGTVWAASVAVQVLAGAAALIWALSRHRPPTLARARRTARRAQGRRNQARSGS